MHKSSQRHYNHNDCKKCYRICIMRAWASKTTCLSYRQFVT